MSQNNLINGFYTVEPHDNIVTILQKLKPFGENLKSLQQKNGKLDRLSVGQVIKFKNRQGTIVNEKPVVYQDFVGQPFQYLKIDLSNKKIFEKEAIIKNKIDAYYSIPGYWLVVMRQNQLKFSDIKQSDLVNIRIWKNVDKIAIDNKSSFNENRPHDKSEIVQVQQLESEIFMKPINYELQKVAEKKSNPAPAILGIMIFSVIIFAFWKRNYFKKLNKSG